MIKKSLIIAIFLTTLLLAGCSSPHPASVNEAGYEPISVETLEAMLEERRESFLLVNTHIPFEGNLPTTDFSVAYNETAQNLHLFPADKDAEIVLYCMNDPMSHIAAEQLVEAGFQNIKVLEGGMTAWQRAGLPLEMEP